MTLSRELLASVAWCGVLMAASVAIQPAAALTIDPTFTSSITSDPNSTEIEYAIDQAISTIDSLYSNTVNVRVGNSTLHAINIVFDSVPDGDFLGESETSDYGYTYSQYTGRLATLSAAHPTNTVLASAVAHLGSGNMPGSQGFVEVTTADAQAVLGYNVSGCYSSTGAYVSACGTKYDGVVTLNTGIPDNYTTTAVAGEYSVIAGMEHEINEMLGGGGQGSVLNDISCGTPKSSTTDVGVLDLYRYASAGVPSFNSCDGETAFLSVDGGTTDIVQFNNNPGDDLADFSPIGYVQSAVATQGIAPPYNNTTPEFKMMESIGYDGVTTSNVVPEPASLAVLGSALAGILAVRRRRTGMSL